MAPLGNIEVRTLFPLLHRELIDLLESLAPEDWARPSACRLWDVKDEAAHLLDGDLRRLSLVRDMWTPPVIRAPIQSHEDLVALLDRLNAEWVQAARRLSPKVLVELLRWTGPRVTDHFLTLDPQAPARFPVRWAGETASSNWFDLAREYTERWHHQQHIREAVGAPGLTSAEWMAPALRTFLRALPFAYREVEAPEGTSVAIAIDGYGGGGFLLVRGDSGWQVFEGRADSPEATVHLSTDTAWRLFTKGLTPVQAIEPIPVEGDERLGVVFRGAIGVMG